MKKYILLSILCMLALSGFSGNVIPDSKRWPGNVIYYEKNITHPLKDRILSAMNHISSNTNLCFREGQDNQYRIIFKDPELNRSYTIPTGYCAELFGESSVYLLPNESQATIIHELLHVAGLHHEHERMDRNLFITFSGPVSEQGEINGAYDFESIMHYPSGNGNPTFTFVNPEDEMHFKHIVGNATGMSAGDIATVNELYPNIASCMSFVCRGCDVDLEPICNTINAYQIGNQLQVSNLVIQNNGGLESIPYTISYYLSPNSDIGSGTLIGFQNMEILLGGESHVIPTISHDISHISNGTYYLITIVDLPNETDDINGANNYCYGYGPIQITATPTCSDNIPNQGELDVDCGGPCPPCQTPVNLKSTACATPIINGDQVTILYEIMNTGSINSGPFYTGWYLKEVGSPNTSPFAVLAYHPGINAVTSEALSVVFDLGYEMDMANLSAGDYELYMSIDALSDVTESNESDNWCTNNSTLSYTTTNLTHTNQCTTTEIVGDYLNVYYDITNTGNSDAGIFTISWYVLENGSSIPVAFGDEHQIVGLPANTTESFARSFYLPQAMSEANLAPGPYSLGFYIDSYNNISESSEIDNLCLSTSSFTYANSCDPNGNFQGAYDGTFNYAAPNYINAPASGNQCTILPNSDVTLQAGNYVMLNPGFVAEYNSTFHAFIDDCGGAMIVAEEGEETPDNITTENINFKFTQENIDIAIRNYPNPFTGQTTIEYNLPDDSPVMLVVTDFTGKQIAILENNEQKTKGVHTVSFDGSNYPAGMYYYTIQAGEYMETQKMILMK